MSDAAFRPCPSCGTRNRHYMMVCTRCARSLEGVPLVGTPPPGAVVVVRRGRLGRVAFGLLALAVAAAALLLLSRILRSSGLERDAAASTGAAGEGPPALPSPHAGRSAGWETLEQRFAEVEARPTSTQPTPPPTTVTPAPPPTTVAPAPPATTVAPAPPATTVTPAPPPTTVAPAPPSPAPTVPEPSRWRTASTDPPEPAAPGVERTARPAHEETDPARLRAERSAALRRAEERLRALERRADELRGRADEEGATDADEQQERRLELAKVLRQLEQAERQVIRAQWALRDVEP
jgi:outer membrane biosynthesis protein TonB